MKTESNTNSNIPVNFLIYMNQSSFLTLLVSIIVLGYSPARFGQENAPTGPSPLAAGQAPPLPKPGLLAQPRSTNQIGFPVQLTQPVIPPDNPLTPEKIALGQKLFFDGRMSADGTVACATCHDPAR